MCVRACVRVQTHSRLEKEKKYTDRNVIVEAICLYKIISDNRTPFEDGDLSEHTRLF